MVSGMLFALVQQAADTAGAVRGSIDYSVSIGELLQIAGNLIAVVAAYTRLVERLKGIETKLDILWDDYRRRSRLTRE